MIPLCFIIGDSTALGTPNALAAQGIRCSVHARVGAPSGEPVRSFRSPLGAGRVLIALGSNDPTNPRLARNLLVVRQRTMGSRVTWLAPYHAGAARIVTDIARSFGDPVIQLAAVPSRDRVHPQDYGTVAAALQWQKPASTRVDHRTTRALPSPEQGSSARQAVVLSF